MFMVTLTLSHTIRVSFMNTFNNDHGKKRLVTLVTVNHVVTWMRQKRNIYSIIF